MEKVYYLLRSRGSFNTFLGREMQPEDHDALVCVNINQPTIQINAIYRTYEAAESVLFKLQGKPPAYLTMTIEEIRSSRNGEDVRFSDPNHHLESKKFPERPENKAMQVVPTRPQAGPRLQNIGFIAKCLSLGTGFPVMTHGATEDGIITSAFPGCAKQDFVRRMNLEIPLAPYEPRVNEVVSVQTKDGRYRATRAGSAWALLDEGYFSSASDPWPMSHALANLPAFACVLDTLPQVPERGKLLWATVLDKDEENVLVKIKGDQGELEGRLSLWVPTGSNDTELLLESLEPQYDLKLGIEVILMGVEITGHVVIRLADDIARQQYDALVIGIMLEAVSAPAMKRLPSINSVVLAPYGDYGMYRAAVLESLASSSYELVFLELGVKAAIPVSAMRKPGECSRAGLLVYRLPLANIQRITAPALKFVNVLAKCCTLMRLTHLGPDGIGLQGVQGDLAQRLTQLSRSEWRNLQESGCSLQVLPRLMKCELTYVLLQLGDTLLVQDYSMIQNNELCCTLVDMAATEQLQDLMFEIKKYCAQTTGPYKPLPNEVCIVDFLDGWCYRAEAIETRNNIIVVDFLDFGNVEYVPSSHIRKAMREHIEVLPVQSFLCYIAGFPENPSRKLQRRAQKLLEKNGPLTPSAIEPVGIKNYSITLPWLIQALWEEHLL